MTAPTGLQEATVARVQALIPDDLAVRQISMFGGCALMVEDALLVSVAKDGSLLVRVDPVHHDDYVGMSGASAATMGNGRPMSTGWIRVTREDAADDPVLALWVQAALAYNQAASLR